MPKDHSINWIRLDFDDTLYIHKNMEYFSNFSLINAITLQVKFVNYTQQAEAVFNKFSGPRNKN